LLPDDDLTLATILKGPLIGLDDDDLFVLAHERRGRLWDVLSAHAGQDTRFGAAHGFLAALLARTDYLTPASLYAHVLIACDGRRKILSRLGPDADDPIDEFMNLAYAYQQSHAPSLQGFLHWLAAGDTEIKRDLEQSGADSVRVITAHGSKGLQAPIVFLPDTAQVPKMQDELLWSPGARAVLLWSPSVPEQDAATRRLREAAIAAQDREYRRLLYVAMTRAEDRLYVCGWKTRQATRTTTWYDMIRAGVTSVPHDTAEEPLLAPVIRSAEVVRLVSPQEVEVPQQDSPAATAMAHTLPQWARIAPAPEPTPPAPLAPSTATRIEPAVFSPLADLGVQRFQRGIIIHRLLQTLPELPRERREAAATAFLARFAIEPESRSQIVRETLAVLDDPHFAPLFAANSRAEVPLTGLVGTHVVSAQIDRLAVTADEVWIVDYKTNRPPPRDAAHVDPAYLFQMATYRAVIQAIYPAHKVRCVLLWTAGPFLMELAPGDLDGALDAD
jgi:ATP-dependent helicase/nuclease subunit A